MRPTWDRRVLVAVVVIGVLVLIAGSGAVVLLRGAGPGTLGGRLRSVIPFAAASPLGSASPGGEGAPPPPPDPSRVQPCGTHLCLQGKTWFMYGASEYEAIHNPAPSGIDNPQGTVALAAQAKLNTIRVINFYDTNQGKPDVQPYSETQWRKVDAMVATAGAAGMRVLLDLSDYRNILWRNCIDPYGWDWAGFIRFVAGRKNTVTGATYGSDRQVALVALAGEPLKPGTYDVSPNNTGAPCKITYSSDELTRFYKRTLGQWRAAAGGVPAFTGGLGYLNFNSGIDWRSIFSLGDNRVCGIKTYGRMIDWVPTGAAYCAGIKKPLIDEEFGWQQSTPDATRAAQFSDTVTTLHNHGAAGALFWNLGYEQAPQSYEVGPSTPATFAAVQRAAP